MNATSVTNSPNDNRNLVTVSLYSQFFVVASLPEATMWLLSIADISTPGVRTIKGPIMSDKPEYMTREGKANLEQKLHILITDERKKVADRIAAAKELGDISESGEYEDAKKSQALLEGEIRSIKDTLARAQLINEDQNGVREVRIGSTVKVRIDGDDETETWTIVGSTEASPRNGKISNESPIGSKLLGKKEQNTVEVQTPSGPMHVTILKIN